MRDIRRPEIYEATIKQLTEIEDAETQVPTFETIRELIIFSALLGFSKKKRVAGLKLGNPVPWRLFESARKDGMVFWIGLMEKKSAEILHPDSGMEDQLVQIFEEYAAGGLELITDMLKQNASDVSGFKTIRNFLVDEVHNNIAPPAPTGLSGVTF